MLRRLLRLFFVVMGLAFAATSYAQDLSAMWNAAKRWKLGLDGSVRPAGEPGVPYAVNNPPNTPDIAIFNPSPNAQSENSIGVNPANPNQLMVSTNGRIPGANPVVHQTWAFSTDAGATWPFQSEDLPPNIIDSFGDPVAFFDVSGKAYFCTLGSPGGIYFVTTTDLGATWSARSNADVLNSTNDDKQHACADHSGVYPNNVYAAWTDFGVSGTPVQFSRSTDGGVTWGARTTLAIGSNRGQGVHISTGPNGEVYVMWAHYTTGTAEVGIGFAKSTDGGATFSTPAIAFPINGIRISNGGIATLNNTRAASFPYFDVDRSNGPRRGWIYVVTPELDVPSTGQADVYLRRSTDGGTTWSSAIRVNGPDVAANKWQWMASIAVDQVTGGITVGYHSKDTTGSVYADSLFNRYAAFSNDGGNTWENFVVSDVRSPLRPQGTPNTNANYNGDYYETAAWGGRAWPCWTDRRTGINKAYVELVVFADPIDPNPPTNVSAFSDYRTPTSMLLKWRNPTTLVNGDPIGPFVIRIKRNGVQITERPSTDTSFTDVGLTRGQTYTYILQTRLTANDSLSPEAQTVPWIAGGALTPKAPTNLSVTGTGATGYKIRWTNPSQQVDGTILNDFAGIRLYRNGSLIATLARATSDTARVDSTTDSPPQGLYSYYVTAIDNEVPINESAPSNTGLTPLEIPIMQTFTTAGAPDSLVWINRNTVVNADAVNPPSPSFALNLAGNPSGQGLDTITSRVIDMSLLSGMGVTLGFFHQPQGAGDVPEAADSLVCEARNSLGQWLPLLKLPGSAVRDFQFARFNLDSVSAGGGTFFYNGFQFRFRSRATTVTTTRQDDWFIDDVFFGVPTGVPQMVVSPQSIADTVLVNTNDSTSYMFTVRNNNPFGTSLNYTVTESPAVTWLSATPASGSVPGSSTHLIRARVNFIGATPGVYTTSLIVVGNDPANASDTVQVHFLVNPAPAIVVRPDSFFFSLNRGDSTTASVVIRNNGAGPLEYASAVEGGFAGYTEDNCGNSSLSLATSSNLMRGGVVQVTTPVQLLEIRSYLNITTSREMRFVVYENMTGTSFTKIFEQLIPSSGTGTQWYSSGPVNILLEAGKRYAIGVNWQALSGLTYYWQASAPVPVPISFGTLTGGLAQTVYPPPATITQGALTSLYYTQFVTASGRWLTVTTAGTGTVAPGDSTTLGFKVTTALLPGGTANAALLINNNDPLVSQVRVPVRLDVLTDVAESGSGIPEQYMLTQNYPNPFNPSTQIRFGLPQESLIRLKIYNIIGQEVASLADEVRPAGYFVATWEGTNNAGGKVGTGVYFYRFEAKGLVTGETFTSVKKMMMVK